MDDVHSYLLMLATLTLFTRPLMDFFKASQAIRWYSLLDLSVRACWRARSFAGGTYLPPLRELRRASYSFFAAACLSSSPGSWMLRLRGRSANCLSLPGFRATPFSRAAILSIYAEGGDLRRTGDGDREGGDLFRGLYSNSA